MTKFKHYLNEENNKGYGISFIDIDETVFKTFAKIKVIKDGKVIKTLNNQEYNSYNLKDGESFDYGQFRDANFFNKTSIPIDRTVKRIKKMLSQIKENKSKSKIIFLTARADFNDKTPFLKTFEEHGISMNKKHVYVERTGNIKTGTVDANKKQVMLQYLKEGIYRRARLLDDHIPNLKALIDIEQNLPKEIDKKVRETYNLSDNEPSIKFFALYVKEDGTLQKLN